jgi:hypothetical protein
MALKDMEHEEKCVAAVKRSIGALKPISNKSKALFSFASLPF